MSARQLNQQLVSYWSHSEILINHIPLFCFLLQDGFFPVFLFDSHNRSHNGHNGNYWKLSIMVTFFPKLRVEDRNHYKQSYNGTCVKDHLAPHKSSNIAQCSGAPLELRFQTRWLSTIDVLFDFFPIKAL